MAKRRVIGKLHHMLGPWLFGDHGPYEDPIESRWAFDEFDDNDIEAEFDKLCFQTDPLIRPLAADKHEAWAAAMLATAGGDPKQIEIRSWKPEGDVPYVTARILGEDYD